MSAQDPRRLRIAVLPPDERPNTAGYARQIGTCNGADVIMPPAELMPRFREPADVDALAAWLREVDGSVDAHVISLDLLVHGGLVPSRLSHDRIGEVIPRLEVLRGLRAPISAYQVVTRLPHYDNAGRSRQEPEYWATHGRKMFALSQTWDRQARGEARADDVEAALHEVPAEFRHDLVRRRMRNHAVNLAALELAADGTVADLMITSDDTAPRGLPAGDRAALSTWNQRLDAGALLYPGADEVPSVLVARAVSRAHGVTPRIFVGCPDAEGLQRTALYEDSPIDQGIDRQIRALGAERVPTAEDADLVLMVHAPAAEPGDWTADPITQDSSAASALVAAATSDHLTAGRRVALADVRYANGSDPTLLTMLDESRALERLEAYGGWNTAGNTLGTTLAAGVSALLDGSEAAKEARRRFLIAKIIEDARYLPTLRVQLQQEFLDRGLTEPPLDELPALGERAARDLTSWASGVHALRGVRVTNASWPREYLFTIDFDVELDQ
ncbi:hypothetical protein QF046_002116 [Microbacterium sp. W4I4]|uniref:DUF4127 family protein n=1 Tax=Microbacterium sp. W4I4 TaxID=3042295 RepID=UPI0027821A6F|nr:DUF4127 family protein [Microbacterium sp. W4I4]MDQ0614475.1 hypothetical protein [Microbacterium sp. W4I4]